MLFEYMRQVQRLINDARQTLIDPADIQAFVNQARDEVAMRSQCLRLLTPISGSVRSATVTNPGVSYTAPTVTITAPDFPSGVLPYPSGLQAMATASVAGGTIAGVGIVQGGSGYFQPQAIINDPTGSGATITLSLNSPNTNLVSVNTANLNQEVYNFSDIDLSGSPGYGSIIAVRSVAMIYDDYRYLCPLVSFTQYQAYIRNYPFQYTFVPEIGSQFGQGSSGSLYLYPIASQAYQMEWDCTCLASPLTDDGDYEAIPDPWRQAVPWYAAKMCYFALQNFNSARAMEDQFNQYMKRYRTAADPGRMINPYGRG